jgi:hypothetical protein
MQILSYSACLSLHNNWVTTNMAIEITSLFRDILESPEQKQQRQMAEGFARSQNAVSQLTGLATAAAPLVGTMAELQGRRTEDLQRGAGRLLGRDVRSTSEKVSDALKSFNPQDPKSVSQTTQMLQQLGLGPQAAQLSSMALEEQQRTKAIGQEAGLRELQMSAADIANRRNEQAIGLDAAQETRAGKELELRQAQEKRLLEQQGFEVTNSAGLLAVQQQNADLRAEELALTRERNEQLAAQQTDQTRRMIAEATTESMNSRASAVNMLSIAKQYELTQPKPGFFGDAASAWRGFLGTQGGEDAVRQEYVKLRNEATISGLPPGAASDKDIEIAMRGWPPENAKADYLAQFMRGQAKLAALSAAMNSSKSTYISANNGNLAGFVEYWDEASSGEDFIKGIEGKYAISFDAQSPEDERAAKDAILQEILDNR